VGITFNIIDGTALSLFKLIAWLTYDDSLMVWCP